MVIGLAMAAQGATEKVEGLTEDEELTQQLERMREEARETEERGTRYARISTARRPRCSTRQARPRPRPPR